MSSSLGRFLKTDMKAYDKFYEKLQERLKIALKLQLEKLVKRTIHSEEMDKRLLDNWRRCLEILYDLPKRSLDKKDLKNDYDKLCETRDRLERSLHGQKHLNCHCNLTLSHDAEVDWIKCLFDDIERS